MDLGSTRSVDVVRGFEGDLRVNINTRRMEMAATGALCGAIRYTDSAASRLH